jgi:thymidylate synthase
MVCYPSKQLLESINVYKTKTTLRNMKSYLEIVNNILTQGEVKENRTGISTIAIPGATFRHDMKHGFPLLTTKKIPFRLIASELEFFIKGLTDKQWLLDRNNHIWDEWCNPEKVPYGHDPETKKKMLEERDLGAIYGFQWRHFGANYQNYDTNYAGQGVDQLEKLIHTLKTNPNDRRMIVSAWNPQSLHQMALPPCHFQYQVTVINNKLNLMWTQRSIDTMLGLPFNIASYGLLLHLLAKEAGMEEGVLTGFLGDTHIYENHLAGAREQLSRSTMDLPEIETADFTSIFDWDYQQTRLVNYQSHPRIKFEVAV